MDSTIWCAGFFDGEGCISIARQKKVKTEGYNYFLQISVGQKDRKALEFLQETLGGKISEKPSIGVPYWYAAGKNAAAILEQLLPHLIVKKTQAILAIEFQKRRKGGSLPRNPDQDALDHIAIAAMKRDM